MDAFFSNHAVIAILVVIAIVLIIYIGGAIASSGSILSSKLLTATELNRADLVYYLPAASLDLIATASIVTTTDAAGKLVAGELLALDLVSKANIIPDTDSAFCLTYDPSIFAADELKLTVDQDGLLDTLQTTTEDRLGSILSEIAAAPKSLFESYQELANEEKLPPSGVTANLCFSKTFTLPLTGVIDELIILPWKINIPGIVDTPVIVDASLTLGFPADITTKFVLDKQHDDIPGVLSRPMRTVRMTVRTSLGSQNEHLLAIPDSTRLVNIMVERSGLVKRVNTPKFHSGLLIENYLNKPSEFESFVSIPINIGKALVSIPSKLFTFTLQNKNSQQIAQLEMDKKIQDLKKNLVDTKTQAQTTSPKSNPDGRP